MHDKQLDIQVLQIEVQHYKDKAKKPQNCHSKIYESKEVQAGCGNILENQEVEIGKNRQLLGPLNYYRINILPEKHDAAKEEIKILRIQLADKKQKLQVRKFLFAKLT